MAFIAAGLVFVASGVAAFMMPAAGRGALLPLGPTAFGFIGVIAGIGMFFQAFRARKNR
ncbi:hypothetical protein [Georgenia satyanarayanai]|uniref:hypothetical protein n=1 Tax=Georgenia satyanarayanai TaxID=860221 RepID=UPI00186AE714|nr:hypothetical protein [Georgenia satyanarayanai]